MFSIVELQLESSLIGGPSGGDSGVPNNNHQLPSSGRSSDLFSEIHGGFAERIAELETDNGSLEKRLGDAYRTFGKLLEAILTELKISHHAEGTPYSRSLHM